MEPDTSSAWCQNGIDFKNTQLVMGEFVGGDAPSSCHVGGSPALGTSTEALNAAQDG